MSDLRQRVPGHALIDELLHQWDLGTIHVGAQGSDIVIDDAARGWYLGVIGERRVAHLLSQLGSEYTILHSVPAGVHGRDIDHLVIGPTGVFTINTKYHPGKDIWSAGFGLRVNNFPQNSYIQGSITEILQAARVLSQGCGMRVEVTGLIVFVDPAKMTRTAPAGGDLNDIHVVTDQELLGRIRREIRYSPDHVAHIVAAASEPTTWLAAPPPSTVGVHITREFEALEAEVGEAMAARAQRNHAAGRTDTTSPPRRVSGSPSRPAAPRRGTGRGRNRERVSPVERIMASVVIPIGLIIGLFIWAQNFGK